MLGSELLLESRLPQLLGKMRLTKVVAIWLWFFMLVGGTSGCASPNAVQQNGPQKTIATAPFRFSGWSADYFAVVQESNSLAKIPVRRISLIAKGQASAQFEYKTPDAFLGFWPDNGEWCGTLWSTGSAMTLRIFAPSSTGIGLVLEKGLQQAPEVVDLDGDGKSELILTSGRHLVSNGKTVEEPSNCAVFKWSASDHRFEQVQSVPWSKRQDLFGRLMK